MLTRHIGSDGDNDRGTKRYAVEGIVNLSRLSLYLCRPTWLQRPATPTTRMTAVYSRSRTRTTVDICEQV